MDVVRTIEWRLQDLATIVASAKSGVVWVKEMEPCTLTSDEARRIAQMLLDAADQAEGSDQR